MLVLRFLALLFLLVATVALVNDVTPFIGGSGPLTATSLARHWQDLAPGTFQGARTMVGAATAPWVWDVVFATLAALPTFMLFGALSLLAAFGGRRRHRVSVFAN